MEEPMPLVKRNRSGENSGESVDVELDAGTHTYKKADVGNFRQQVRLTDLCALSNRRPGIAQ
jgi:hypothetical protein